ncbi:hypothetical protein POVCU2_0034700 [Plasmodium ovale curtisi]|uniref:Uncharacterized protein n=1 Tax=Plasmodium ovale curtisi TaxID=864141 RepID=A0A1A8WWN8_PLAOA|nr:hypothetical protein POVCU2_0034700 [Plasmodium ovale curtisi]SBS96307.1 hypothetical protein POVCU1_031980 [Plasmodium ovale curtisi]
MDPHGSINASSESLCFVMLPASHSSNGINVWWSNGATVKTQFAELRTFRRRMLRIRVSLYHLFSEKPFICQCRGNI